MCYNAAVPAMPTCQATCQAKAIDVLPRLGHQISSYFSPMKHLPMKKTSADETLSANERLSETSQNLSLAITLSLAVAKTVGMLIVPQIVYILPMKDFELPMKDFEPNSLHSANERF